MGRYGSHIICMYDVYTVGRNEGCDLGGHRAVYHHVSGHHMYAC